jgi:hypothetical protein
MAAFASSSRFIYALSARENDIPGFKFEEQLPTTVGGVANMDGYQELGGRFTFVEAKCREPYSHSVKQAIKRNYKDVYAYLREKMPRVFSCVMEDIPDAPDGKEPQNKMNVVFFCHNKVVAYFDIKQMICHLAGIATAVLKNDYTDVPLAFEYLVYNPENLSLPEKEGKKILDIYQKTLKEATSIDFKKLFGIILNFLAQTTKYSAPNDNIRIVDNFTFEVCEQKNNTATHNFHLL